MKTTKRGCTHAEGYCVSDIHIAEWGDLFRGPCQVRENDKHDCGYVDARNRLIPAAERVAKDAIQAAGQPMTPGAFARQFAAEMERLVRATGLVQ